MEEKLYFLAVKFLRIRPRSEKELRDYFKKKSYKITIDQQVIESIITKLKTQKFLSDKAFVEWWIEQRTKVKPLGWRLIKMELQQKGISNEMLEDFKQELRDDSLSVGSEKEKAMELAQRKMKLYKGLSKEKIYQRLGGFLARRGFGMDTIRATIDEVLKK